MNFLAMGLIVLVAVAHVFFLILEMFLWTKPPGLKRFKMTPEQAAATAILAKNMGLYNGFLAAGLVWGVWLNGTPEGFHLQLFFLGCVVVAGIYGGITAKRAILYTQALPGVLALLAVLVS